jgi:hypothetical protein
MPATSIRDLVIKDDDLAVATHGRGFWILDDITPLRQLTPEVQAAEAFLFAPQTATRVRWNTNTDTPLPPDEPAGENPPDGAIIDYSLGAGAAGPVVLEILDGKGALVRRYSSEDPVPPVDQRLSIPTYWLRPPQVLPTAAGMHRFVWDMHYQPVPGARAGYGMGAVVHNTPPAPTTPWVMPGTYTVRLTVNGRSQTQPLRVRMDPRVKTPKSGLEQQFALSMEMYDGQLEVIKAVDEVREVRAQIKSLQERAGQTALSDALAALDKKVSALEGARSFGFRRGGFGRPDTLGVMGMMLGMFLRELQAADVSPTTQMAAAVADAARTLADLMGRWSALKTRDLAELNSRLRAANLPPIEIK